MRYSVAFAVSLHESDNDASRLISMNLLKTVTLSRYLNAFADSGVGNGSLLC